MQKKEIIKKLFFFWFVVLVLAVRGYSEARREFSFDERTALSEWQEKIFFNKVFYTIDLGEINESRPEPRSNNDSGTSVEKPWWQKTRLFALWQRWFGDKGLQSRGGPQGAGVLHALSDRACSGIFYQIRFSPVKTPLVSWRWKVVSFPVKDTETGSSEGWIEKDDYAARFYVIFPGITFFGTTCLEYVWSKDLPEGTILTSPYFDNIKIIVAESGTQNKDAWVSEERDIVADYQTAFGKKPGRVGAIAVMTDADNTMSTAEAYYDEIKVGYNHRTK